MPEVRYVTIRRFCDLTGYTENAVNSKIKRGDWLQDVVWMKAPDGRRLIDLNGYEAWVRQTSVQHCLRRR